MKRISRNCRMEKNGGMNAGNGVREGADKRMG